MKFLYLVLALSLAGTAASAQSSWKVILNDKAVLHTSGENEEKNVILLKPSDLKKKKDFIINYTEKNSKNDWERVIMAYDRNDHEITQQNGTRFRIKNATLLSWFKKSDKIMIYTWALPKDPALRAAIRVRRVHLCTLVLQ